jgi:hypothetical protein
VQGITKQFIQVFKMERIELFSSFFRSSTSQSCGAAFAVVALTF